MEQTRHGKAGYRSGISLQAPVGAKPLTRLGDPLIVAPCRVPDDDHGQNGTLLCKMSFQGPRRTGVETRYVWRLRNKPFVSTRDIFDCPLFPPIAM